MLRQKLSSLVRNIFKTNRENPSQSPFVKGRRGEKEGKRKEFTPIELEQITKINARLEQMEESLKKATGGYRSMLVKENPEILPELISGESIEGLDHSLEVAKELTRKVQLQLEARKAAERVPAGAPARTPIDIESMSADEKIAYGLSQRN
jgi:hypothetical protein